jgi:transcriptional regulator with XRE-family HTH domain
VCDKTSTALNRNAGIVVWGCGQFVAATNPPGRRAVVPEQAPTLRDMVKSANDSGLTYEQLAKNAVDPRTGHKASGGFINDIARGQVNRLPEPRNLRAIAAGLGVPYERVRQAAILQWLPPEEADPAAERQQMIDEINELRTRTDEALAKLEAMDRRNAS